MVIKTNHEYPPIPVRNMDWCAWVDGTEDEDMIQGWGPTEQTAIADLLDRLEESN
jgi:hypothetical protein